jgi:hypothetical protein
LLAIANPSISSGALSESKSKGDPGTIEMLQAELKEERKNLEPLVGFEDALTI